MTLCGVTEESGAKKDLILEPGEHCLPFSCRLLPDLPASFEGQHGCIRYVAKTIIEQTASSSPPSSPSSPASSSSSAAAKSDVVVARRSFTMAPGLNLCFLPEATVSQPGLPLSFLNWAYVRQGVCLWAYGTPRVSIFDVRQAFQFTA